MQVVCPPKQWDSSCKPFHCTRPRRENWPRPCRTRQARPGQPCVFASFGCEFEFSWVDHGFVLGSWLLSPPTAQGHLRRRESRSQWEASTPVTICRVCPGSRPGSAPGGSRAAQGGDPGGVSETMERECGQSQTRSRRVEYDPRIVCVASCWGSPGSQLAEGLIPRTATRMSRAREPKRPPFAGNGGAHSHNVERDFTFSQDQLSLSGLSSTFLVDCVDGHFLGHPGGVVLRRNWVGVPAT